jgi:hypothetical protein
MENMLSGLIKIYRRNEMTFVVDDNEYYQNLEKLKERATSKDLYQKARAESLDALNAKLIKENKTLIRENFFLKCTSVFILLISVVVIIQ